MATSPEEIAVQDLLLISEALITWAGPPSEVTGKPRQLRAWTLVDEIAGELGLSYGELVTQIESDWSGPTELRD